MNFKNPFEIFNEIYYELTHSKKKVDIESLKDDISNFEKNTIIMIDEIDSLFLKTVANQDRILEFFKLSNLTNPKMMVLGVSNSNMYYALLSSNDLSSKEIQTNPIPFLKNSKNQKF